MTYIIAHVFKAINLLERVISMFSRSYQYRENVANFFIFFLLYERRFISKSIQI